ncbi:caspase family protein [Sediminitomix flava]|uniref:Putative caspase-like protein n=1 Tax=Sediminitomix flava TaxID=379075 RepID=A0A315ZC13_SEDFL|nr:caspase family protein [Sediminitomix flava]PWJ43116.1 putative caspase-like protein [Sediminitomix flava]
MTRIFLLSIATFLLSLSTLFAQDAKQDPELQAKWHVHMDKAELLYQEENYEEALYSFVEAIRVIPTDTTAYIYGANCAFVLNDFGLVQDFANDFQGYFKYLSPDIAMLLTQIDELEYLGKVQEMVETDVDQALVLLDSAAEKYPARAIEFSKFKLNIFFQEQRIEEAVALLENLVETYPEEVDFKYNLALILHQSDDLEGAVSLYEQCLDVDPNYFNALYNLGIINYNTAVGLLNEMNQLTDEAFQAEGNALRKQSLDHFLKAKPYFEKTAELNTEDNDAIESLNSTVLQLANLRQLGTAFGEDEIVATNRSSVDDLKEAENSIEEVANDGEGIDALKNSEESIAAITAEEEVVEAVEETPKAQGQSKLLVSNLRFEYPEGAQELEKGGKGFIKFRVDNFGTGVAEEPTVKLFSVIETPGLVFDKNVVIENLEAMQGVEVSLEVSYTDSQVATRGFKAIKTDVNSFKLMIADKSLSQSDILSFDLNLSDKPSAAEEDFAMDLDIDVMEAPKYYLLMISVDEYTEWTPLDNAVKDAQDVRDMLTRHYTFEDENVFELYNEEVTASNIRKVILELKEKIQPTDNLLIYYSGHGYYDKAFEEGFWVPVNGSADLSATDTYISNETILKYVKMLDTQHTFLIADACFSGSLFAHGHRGASYADEAELFKSRWGLTSGFLQYVSDGEAGTNSPFAKALMTYLRVNRKDKMLVTQLIQYVKETVYNNTDGQMPMGDRLRNVGDEGGEFVFRKRPEPQI